MKWTITKKDAGCSVIEFLRHKHAFSRRLLKGIKDQGGSIRINSDIHHLRYILQEGDVVDVSFPPEEVAPFLVANPIPLEIIYEDDMLLVVNKPPGMATIPSRNQPTHTLANALLNYYNHKGIKSTIHVVTRLDRDTSGLVLIAKNRYGHSLFGKMQTSHQIKRKYIAIVNGCPHEQKGTIDAPIGRKEGSIIERTVTDSGQKAVTDYKVIETDPTGRYSLTEIEPLTGRTHQIRVHMAYIDHPLIGDDLYATSDVKIDRHALHCHQLDFKHPLTQEDLHIEAPVPMDMKILY